MKKSNKLSNSILSIILCIVLLVTNLDLSFAVSNTVYIDSAEDLLEFSQNASLDTYFQGKTVVLRSDIDLSNIEFSPIPTFGGIFDGQGHAISGLSISQSGSIQGLFRYLQKDGVIKNLNISGNITPSGSQNIIGGLVGNNKGSIQNCNFNGTVSGKNNIGGLVGINEATGTISNCTSEGRVTGEHYTGGIVGQNLGTILKSTNMSEINTSAIEPTLNLDDINWSQLNSTENVKAHTDTGGIAGFSSGFLQDCINRGTVGYKHMGYNVGGVVGRQSGYLSNCHNYNTVLGRKDVGGIVGQVEPYLMLHFSEDTLQKLNHELDILQNLLSKSFTNARSSSLSVSSQLADIVKSVDDTKDIMQILSRGATDYIDNITDTVNITSRRIAYTLEEIIPILKDGEKLSIILNTAINHIESGFDNLEITSDDMASTVNEAKKALKNLRRSVNLGKQAIQKIKDALHKLLNALGNEENIKKILPEFEEGLTELDQSFIDSSKAISDILKALKDLDIDNPDWNSLSQELEQLSNALASMSTALSKLKEKASTIFSKALLEITTDVKNHLNNIFYDMRNSSRKFELAIGNIYDALSNLEATSRQSGRVFRDFSRGFNSFGDASETITTMVVSIQDLLLSLTSEPNIELPNISSEYRQSGESLFDNIGHISSQINTMNTQIKDASNLLVSDIETISNQIFVIFDLLIMSKEDRPSSDFIEDISDENTEDTNPGTVYRNINYGSVNGDVSVGGIAGSIAIEYDLDPEDDVFKKGNPSLNFKYQTTAILRECINHGKATVKESYVGGIVGRMDLGTITGCENYGDVESKSGDYVGGIAGASYSTIRKSFVLSSISGKNYVGGIAGYGKNILDSYTLVQLKNGTEWIGSIAGETEGKVSNNYYVHDTLAAIDGISYSQKASPISYKELLKVETLPKAFSEFFITFIADGNIIEKVPFQYGDSFDLKLLPTIPKKDGYDSHWEDFDFSRMTFNTTVEAIYTPFVTVLSSKIVRDNDTLPLLLAEGRFHKNAELKVFPFDMDTAKFTMKHNKILEVWTIELEGQEDGQQDAILRLLLPETKGKVAVWKSTDKGWEKVNSSINGSYLVFSMDGNSDTFCIVENNFSWIGTIVIICILLIMLLFIKKSKNLKIKINKDINESKENINLKNRIKSK